MRRMILGLATILLVLPGAASAGTITFDNISNNFPWSGWNAVPEGYAGYSWIGPWYVISKGSALLNEYCPNPLPTAGIYSGLNAVANGWGAHTLTLSLGSLLYFSGAYVAPWDPYNGANGGTYFGAPTGPSSTFTVLGYASGSQVFSETVDLNLAILSYTHVSGESKPVDTLDFLTDQPAENFYWVLDNINISNHAPISNRASIRAPEPSLILLLGLGVGIVLLLAWRIRA